MNHAPYLVPVFALIILTLVLLVAQARARIASLKAGEVRIKDIALGQSAWPARATQLNRAYQNQLELPVLFYALVAFVLITGRQDTLFMALEWLFVAARLAHAYLHVTSNNVLRRFQAYSAGLAVLVLMWAIFAIREIAGI